MVSRHQGAAGRGRGGAATLAERYHPKRPRHRILAHAHRPSVHVLHDLPAEDLRRGAFSGDTPAVQQNHPVGEARCEVELMSDEKDRDPAVGPAPE